MLKLMVMWLWIARMRMRMRTCLRSSLSRNLISLSDLLGQPHRMFLCQDFRSHSLRLTDNKPTSSKSGYIQYRGKTNRLSSELATKMQRIHLISIKGLTAMFVAYRIPMSVIGATGYIKATALPLWMRKRTDGIRFTRIIYWTTGLETRLFAATKLESKIVVPWTLHQFSLLNTPTLCIANSQ